MKQSNKEKYESMLNRHLDDKVEAAKFILSALHNGPVTPEQRKLLVAAMGKCLALTQEETLKMFKL